MSFAIGLVASAVIRLGMCRNVLLGTLIALLLAAWSVAVTHYVAYRHIPARVAAQIAAEKNVSSEVARQLVSVTMPSFGRYVALRVQTGWSVGKGGKSALPIDGALVYVMWGLEAVIIALLAVSIGAGAAAAPFCESCGAWADSKVELGRFPIGDRSILSQLRAASSAADLLRKPPANAHLEEIAANTLVYEIAACPKCGQLGFLTVTEHAKELDSKGKERTTKNAVLKEVMIEGEDLKRMVQAYQSSGAAG